MGSDESYFNVSLIMRSKVTRQRPQATTFLKRKENEAESSQGPSVYQPNALPLGQTGSHNGCGEAHLKKLQRLRPTNQLPGHDGGLLGIGSSSSVLLVLAAVMKY